MPLHCTFAACHSNWVTVAFYSTFWISSEVVYVQRYLVFTWLVPREATPVSARAMHTIQPCTMPRNFMQCHIRRVHACLFVTCHLHFWQNERDLLCATAVTRPTYQMWAIPVTKRVYLPTRYGLYLSPNGYTYLPDVGYTCHQMGIPTYLPTY